MKIHRNPPRAHGFTLVELLVTIAILAILIALITSVGGSVRMRADQAKATSNLKQIATGFLLYATENNGLWPEPRVTADFQWTKAVYPYIYPDEPAPTNADIASPARVFVSPRADPAKHTNGRLNEGSLLNGNIVGFGYNTHLPVVGPFPTAYGNNKKRTSLLLETPAKTALLMDSYNFAASPGGIWIEEASRRWDGHVLVAYCSGNVEKMPLESIPLEDESPEGRAFWSGLPNP